MIYLLLVQILISIILLVFLCKKEILCHVLLFRLLVLKIIPGIRLRLFVERCLLRGCLIGKFLVLKIVVLLILIVLLVRPLRMIMPNIWLGLGVTTIEIASELLKDTTQIREA